MIEVALMMDPPLLDLLPFIEVLQLLIIIFSFKIFVLWVTNHFEILSKIISHNYKTKKKKKLSSRFICRFIKYLIGYCVDLNKWSAIPGSVRFILI